MQWYHADGIKWPAQVLDAYMDALPAAPAGCDMALPPLDLDRLPPAVLGQLPVALEQEIPSLIQGLAHKFRSTVDVPLETELHDPHGDGRFWAYCSKCKYRSFRPDVIKVCSSCTVQSSHACKTVLSGSCAACVSSCSVRPCMAHRMHFACTILSMLFPTILSR